jgi:hypothetical protein
LGDLAFDELLGCESHSLIIMITTTYYHFYIDIYTCIFANFWAFSRGQMLAKAWAYVKMAYPSIPPNDGLMRVFFFSFK